MAYWRGSQFDRQQRVAQGSQQIDQVRGTPLVLQGKDAFPPGQSSYDSRRPIGYSRPAYRLAVYDANSNNAVLPEKLGKDQMAPGQSTLDSRRPAAYLAARSVVDLRTYVDASEFWIFGTDKFPPGQTTTDTRRPAAYLAKAYRYPVYDPNQGNALLPEHPGLDVLPPGQSTLDSRRPVKSSAIYRLASYDANAGNSVLPELAGTDAMNAGEQFTELPPISSLRARDYSFTPPINLCCLSTVVQQILPGLQVTDTLPAAFLAGPQRARDYTWAPPISLNLATVVQPIPYGQQSTDSLPAHAAFRARDYTWTQDLIPTLIGQDAMAAGAQRTELAPSPAPLRLRDYTFTASFPLTLVSQDAMLAGDQSTALPPIGPQRARDYTFAPPINLSALTTVVQQIPYGAQVTDSLPAHAAFRARDYTWTQDLIPNLIGQDALNAGEQSFDLAPSPAPLRARDYSLAESFPLVLISQDAMTAGRQSFDLAPIAAIRARDYSFVPPINLCCLTTVQQPIPTGQQSTDSLPPRTAARSRDYTHTDRFELELIGQDAMVAGDQWFLLPTPAPPRASTLGEPGINFTLALDAAATKPMGKGSDASALPPIAAARARDYTWLQSFPLYVYQQIPAGQSSGKTEGPPRGPLRARDYTFLDLTKRNLIGQDSMIVGDTTYASELPPKAYPRAQNLTVPDIHNMMVLFTTARRNPDWDMSQPGDRWTAGSVGSRWVIGPARE